MQEYRFLPQYIARLWIRQLLVILVFLGPAPLYFAWKGRLADNFPILAALGVLAAAIAYLSVKPTQERLSTFRIHLDHQAIGRTGAGLPEIFLRFDEVTRITEFEGRGMVVHSADAARNLSLPAKLEGYSEIRARLALLRNIEVPPGGQRAFARLYWPFWFLAVAAMVYASLLPNPWAMAVSSAILLAVTIWSFVGIARNPALAAQFPRLRWVLLPIALVFALRLVAAVLALVPVR